MVYPDRQWQDLRLFFIAVFPLTIPTTAPPANAHANGGPTSGSLRNHFRITLKLAHYQISHAHALAGFSLVPSYCLENAGLATGR